MSVVRPCWPWVLMAWSVACSLGGCFPPLKNEADVAGWSEAEVTDGDTSVGADSLVGADTGVGTSDGDATDTAVFDVSAPDVPQADAADAQDGSGADVGADAGPSVCTVTSVEQACDDDNACTTDDRCTGAGACAGTARSCDDGLACTVDTCDAVAGCGHTSLTGAVCDDGDPCTVDDVCDADGGCSGAVRDCDDDNPCTGDSCAPSGDCVHDAADSTEGACDDGDACTVEDVCGEGGACAGSPVACDDANPCTLDACDPSDGGCVFTPDVGAPCDDASLCTTADACDASGACGGVATPCDDGDPCTIDTCWPGTGQCASRAFGVTVTKSAGGTEVKGEFGHGHASNAGFVVTGRQTAFLGVSGDVSATFYSPTLLPPVFGTYPLYLAVNSGDDRRLNDAITTTDVSVGVGAVKDAGAWKGLILTRLSGGDVESHLLDDAAELRAVAKTTTGFAAIGTRTPSSGSPGSGALVFVGPFGVTGVPIAFGGPSQRPLNIAGRFPTPTIISAVPGGFVINTIDLDAHDVGDLVFHDAVSWDSFDSAVSDASHLIVTGKAGGVTQIAVFDTSYAVVGTFAVPAQSSLSGVAIWRDRLAITGPRVWDAWVGVYSLAGVLVWEHTLDGDEAYVGAKDVTFDPDGNVAVLGLAGPALPTSATSARYFMQAHFAADGVMDCQP